jgi:polyhydroxyalkanoate synthesis regulator phasin
MKAKIENNKIKVYRRLPRIFNGITGTYPGSFDKQSDEILKQEGFYNVVIPEYDPYIEELGEIYFDEKYEVFTYPVKEKTDLPTLEEAKTGKIHELKNAVRGLYQSIQWYVEMKRTDNEPIPDTVKTKIQNIKTQYENQRNNINSLTNIIDILKYQIPYTAINDMKSKLENIG